MSVQGTIVGEDLSGRVRWFSNKKGYGFIVQDGDDKDIFAHYSSVQEDGFRSLKEDQKVLFTLVETDRGLQASDIRKV